MNIETFSAGTLRGGMPVPLFARDADARKRYWQGWLDTTVYRDLARAFGRGYDPDIALRILRDFEKPLSEGELPTLKHFSLDSRKLRKYFSAMEATFLLRKVLCHEKGVGNDAWIFFDSGLVSHLTHYRSGEGVNLSLVRHLLFNEISAVTEYREERVPLIYFKSARGTPVDLIWNGVPIKIVSRSGNLTSGLGWQERSLTGDM